MNKIKDCFLLDTEQPNCYLIYAPLKIILFAVNKTGANVFLQLKKGNILPGAEKILEVLEKSKINLLPSNLNKNHHVDITICPTFRCQLRCLYCFALGGEKISDLSLDASKAAIDLVLHRHSLQEIQSSRLIWHGGGEPTLAWEVLRKTSLYHRQEAIALGIKPHLSIVSNGIWTKEVKGWIIDNFDRITISCDGPSDIQDKQRPLFNGLPSSHFVYETLRAMAYHRVNFGIRATITENNVKRMPEMVRFFHNLCHPRTLQFERLSICGRCEESKIQAGLPEDYIKYFKEAFEVAKDLDINLVCSGVRIFRRTNYYCGVGGHAICVTPEGLLTTCHRVDNTLHALAKKLVFGKWDGVQYQWKQKQLEQLQSSLSVNNFDRCRDCFCKYTCAGGCITSRVNPVEKQNSDEHCQIIKELSRFRLISIAEGRGILEDIKTKEEVNYHEKGTRKPGRIKEQYHYKRHNSTYSI